MKSIVTGIFPEPIYLTKLDKKFTDTENEFFEKIKSDTTKNQGNITSKNNYVLNEKPFSNLKKELNKIIKDYFEKVINSSNNLKPYITQSWLNYTKENEFHHKHNHPNSIVSGVLYINCDKNFDKICFHKTQYQTISPKVKNFNLFNSNSWSFDVETYDVILFPSSLNHSVQIKKDKNIRISLAFNTFVKGLIGDTGDLTELKL